MWCRREGDRATQIFSIAGRSCPGVLRGLYSGRETGNPPQWVTPLSSAHSFLHSRVQYSVVSSSVPSSLPSGMFPVQFPSFPYILVYSHFTVSFSLSSFWRLNFPFLSLHTINLFLSYLVLIFIHIVIFTVCHCGSVTNTSYCFSSLAVQWPFSHSCAFPSILTHCCTLSYPLFFLLSNHLSVFLSWRVPFESCLLMYVR